MPSRLMCRGVKQCTQFRVSWACLAILHRIVGSSISQLNSTTAQVVAVANDITFNSGAFGPREDAVFRAVTEYALEERLPLLYLAANSGARVGLANEIKKCLQVGRRYLNPFHFSMFPPSLVILPAFASSTSP